MRRLSITNINPAQRIFTVTSNVTALFHGREWIASDGTRSPFWTYDSGNPAPTGTTLLIATTFDVVDNPKYNGSYTVVTQTTSNAAVPSEFSAGSTVIRVNEAIALDGAGAELTSGAITNISTYQVNVAGEGGILVLEQQRVTNRAIELMGRRSSGWGETVLQSLVNLAQCHAGPTPPTGPFLGQLWFRTTDSTLLIKPTAAQVNDWSVINSHVVTTAGGSYRHTQSVAAASWTIVHNLAVPSPGVVEASFFIDVGGGVYKPILPADITYNSVNQFTVTFSSPQTGYAITRSSS